MLKLDDTTLRAIILAAGTAAAGWMAGHGFARGRATDRYVTVKGISEREARADLALWPLRLVVLSSGEEYGTGGPTFIFSGLNTLKPQMIGEATGRAREAAAQFAKDSGSRLGTIRRASQGVFEILPRDQAPGVEEASQIAKTVRVVSTVDYFLR